MDDALSLTSLRSREGFLRLAQIVPDIIPIGRSTWWLWVATGRAPQPVRLSPGVTAWRTSDIADLVERLGRDDAEAA